MTGRTILIAGAAGQDGRLLAGRMVAEGHRVIGLVRPERLGQPGLPCPCVAPALDDADAMAALVEALRPDRFFFLAAAHHSSEGPAQPEPDLQRAMVATNLLGVTAAIRAILRHAPACRLVYAGSSHMHRPGAHDRAVAAGDPRDPVNYYGLTKSWAMDAIRFARDHQGLAGSTAILFNHESPLRPESFLSRKLSVAAARIRAGLAEGVSVRNIGAQADWFDAEDAVDAMVRMAEADVPGDQVVGSGALTGVRDLAEAAFAAVGLDWSRHVTWDADITRPALYADTRRLRDELGWVPRRGLGDLMGRMVEADLARLSMERES
ncbi:GDP-mannose 4,6-dehydratase [Azospirillum doebereinerae]